MVSGGHGRSGRPPDPFSLRQDGRQGEWTLLPARCDQPAPEWPLGPEQTPRQMVLWAELWRRPQAQEWHRLGLKDEIAMLVVYASEAELPHGTRDSRTLYRQHRELCGLSTSGMARLRWKIATEDENPQVRTPRDPQPRRLRGEPDNVAQIPTSSRQRLLRERMADGDKGA